MSLGEDCEGEMGYLKITATLIVDEDDAAAVVEQLNANLDRLEELHTVYEASIAETETGKPENAAPA